MNLIPIDPKTTALVLIDLQHMVVGRDLHPYTAAQVLANAAQLAAAFRRRGAPVVYVRVDITDMLTLPVDQPYVRDPNSPPPPPNASEIAPASGIQPGDLLITKRQWGAFYDTGLDQQLRRRNIRTITLGGIATHIGVESTARAAFDRGYALVFPEDAMSSTTADSHHVATTTIFPRMGHVRTTAEILASLERA